MLLREFEPETVGELKEVLEQFPDDMPITDYVGELLCIRSYKDDETGDLFLEVA